MLREITNGDEQFKSVKIRDIFLKIFVPAHETYQICISCSITMQGQLPSGANYLNVDLSLHLHQFFV